MPHHRKTRAQRVPKGTAPLLFWPHTMKLRVRKMTDTKPGKVSAVRTVVCFHCSPCAQEQGIGQWGWVRVRDGRARCGTGLGR